MKISPIEKRLYSSVSFDAINGDNHERFICSRQMSEAADTIVNLKKSLKSIIAWCNEFDRIDLQVLLIQIRVAATAALEKTEKEEFYV